jgi:hypothetical protein
MQKQKHKIRLTGALAKETKLGKWIDNTKFGRMLNKRLKLA